jgi:osmoprotectant transport system substrate-binding protein
VCEQTRVSFAKRRAAHPPRYSKSLVTRSFRPRVVILSAVLANVILLAAGCGNAPKPIVIGSKSGTDQLIVGEIVAQHLEHRLHRKVKRRPDMGGTLVAYEALVSGDISLYPEYTGAIENVILREQPSSDPSVVLARVRGEMLRTAQIEVIDPLGYNDSPIVVVRSSDAAKARVHTLSEAAAGTFHWNLATSYDFQQRSDGLAALSMYKLPLEQGVRGMEAAQLFPALEKGEVTMITSDSTNGHLTSSAFTILTDDRHVFPPYQACLMVRADVLANEPELRSALAELAGKFSTDTVRKLDAEVILGHRKPADIAAEFLAQAGLK